MDEVQDGTEKCVFLGMQKGLRISSLDGDDGEEEEPPPQQQLEVFAAYEEDEEEEEDFVILGFLEKPKNRWSLLRQMFPSKAGGVPAWLDPVNLPSGKSCVCDICGEPLQFLLQVYAPIEKEYAFHRSLFVFMCSSMNCLLRDQHEQWKRHPEKPSRSVKVFRCQLHQFNPFYSSEPPQHDGTEKPSEAGAALCSWCGTWKGDKLCSGCRTARYCSEKHQVMHWRSGHKTDCTRINSSSQSFDAPNKNETTSANFQKVASITLWPEFEMIIENESEFSTEMIEDNSSTNSLISKGKIDGAMKSLLDTFEGDDEKKSWASFQECIAKAPEQVLRYCRDGSAKPLWPMSSGRPSKADIPNCKYCGGPLCFEFQILPQLLYYFGVKNDVDSLDWATLVIYTCEASCEGCLAYKEEYTWVQLSSQSATVP
ncbi:programmed cell death protein 2 [Carya illinoinensis]|nr:programmed cell death protein 2 [Carya illinoinensis]XP_042987326.1 programmed cell death protein 2 [Carya illinoinensis]XP_042987330.1 programmed cell death protein 2 [Carya illinoinensis]XP_042987338.1 programmed cell death protein 2 [Carya illinoinensis]XP_042987345.1 programmed cell death protein 2 [Carya illinoinensis]